MDGTDFRSKHDSPCWSDDAKVPDIDTTEKLPRDDTVSLGSRYRTDGFRKCRGRRRPVPATSEIIKTLNERCPEITVTNRLDKADFVLTLDHEGGKGLARRRNKIAVFNKDGDDILSRSTRSLGNSVKDACEAILAAKRCRNQLWQPANDLLQQCRCPVDFTLACHAIIATSGPQIYCIQFHFKAECMDSPFGARRQQKFQITS
jgi:hypothetical protein